MKPFTILLSLGVVIIALSSCSLIQSPDPVVQRLSDYLIRTSSGISQGQSIEGGAIVSWFDIPFAKPPVGDLRWKAPRPLRTPEQILAQRDDTACVQKASRFAGVEGSGIVGSEDCLYLDIKAPADFANKQYPVMFWIHGGGNTSGLKDYYDFSKLVASKDVVVVTTNYRLGALGWFTHPAIQGAQDGLDKASNFGTLDIIQSLKWVKNNIAQFGGDANNVTIFGESAGGHNVLTLLASPLAEGLFHKAISQSGYTLATTVEEAYNKDSANPLIERGSWQIIDHLLLREQSQYSTAELRQLLKTINARDFIKLYYDKEQRFDSIPLATIDDIVIPAGGIIGGLSNPDYAKNIPVIAGATKDEVSLWLALHRYFMDSKYLFTKLLPPKVTQKNPPVYDLWVRVRSHAWKLKGADNALAAMESAGYQELYAFQFDWDHQKSSFFVDFPKLFGAAHGTDIAFVTGNFTYGPISSYIYPEGNARDEMQSSMMSAWSNFAKRGIPDTETTVTWQPFSTSSPNYLRLDRNDLLRMDRETESVESLLDIVALSPVLTDYERCYIAWETYNNVARSESQAYAQWNGGLCSAVDMRAEQRALAEKLVAQYGSVDVL